MDKQKWSYLAGIFDGEGCISISSKDRKVIDYRNGKEVIWQRSVLQIDIANTNELLMKWLISNVGGVYFYTDLGNAKWKNRYNWHPKGRKNKEEFLLGIIPYLVLKRDQAKLALAYIRLEGKGTKTQYEELATKCSQLNQKGRSVTTNTQDPAKAGMIESELVSNDESAPMVTLEA